LIAILQLQNTAFANRRRTGFFDEASRSFRRATPVAQPSSKIAFHATPLMPPAPPLAVSRRCAYAIFAAAGGRHDVTFDFAAIIYGRDVSLNKIFHCIVALLI